MPTGIAMRDAREQLFAAAERVLVRDGANGLSSRAVTDEAGVAKGLLHRHFPDFDGFLTQFALEHIARVEARSAALRESAGTGTVVANLTRALADLFGPVMLGVVGLVISRDAVRTRLRQATGAGVPVLKEATRMVHGYLVAERDLGRVTPGADIDALAPTLIGAAHLLLADKEHTPPHPGDLERAVAAVLAGTRH
ncbi:TetR/AcrR family transcriptional regulator [Streptomyces sp. ICBB 8177]|uniref:TetR/AcrR family transcriptional regulator n=1 Tax=Streptomyces sp. ICBB 8177 TaxID=563922 RepID=UPI000D67AFAA|nr:TetR/AcrR family transcriptional regulator [Streptomyces sp. ICBB 8177]PWI44799.1 TetR family transcriptional regulator [Streptomyces sp. ICBB 8177]